MKQAGFIVQQSAAREAGEILAPCFTTAFQPIRVSLPYAISNEAAGQDWAAGHHTGEDHACPEGSLAAAVSWGKVVAIGPNGAGSYGAAYGNLVVVRTANGFWDYMFAHLSSFRVGLGFEVEPGTIVGLTGATGNVTAPHLHFEARPAGGRYGSDVRTINVKQKGHRP